MKITIPRIRKIVLNNPNHFTILWGIISLIIIFDGIVPAIGKLYYLVFLYTLILFCKQLFSYRYSVKAELFLFFVGFISLQALGLVQSVSLLAMRNLIATVCIFCYLYEFVFNIGWAQINNIRLIFWPSLLSFFLFSNLRPEIKDNVFPAEVLFYCCAYLLIEFLATDGQCLFWKAGIVFWAVTVIAVHFKARTTLGVLLIIVAAYYFNKWRNFKVKQLRMLFVLGLMLLFLGTLFYINIKGFSWYDEVNYYSNLYFDKNIDSQRSYLWRTSLNELDWWQVLIGGGTGRLPHIARYATASFHSSYIQTIMQSGLLGLSLLIGIFWFCWKNLILIKKDNLRYYVLACFFGIMIYNCFECTLLQNKAFLGSLQWMILGLGMNYQLRQENKR